MTQNRNIFLFWATFFCHDFHLPTFSFFSAQCWSASTPSSWQHHFFGALAPNFITIKTSRRQKEPAPPCSERTQSPHTVFWGWGDILALCQVPKLCVKHLRAGQQRNGNTGIVQPVPDFSHFSICWLCREGKSPLKELWGSQTTILRSSNLELHGGNPK